MNHDGDDMGSVGATGAGVFESTGPAGGSLVAGSVVVEVSGLGGSTGSGVIGFGSGGTGFDGSGLEGAGSEGVGLGGSGLEGSVDSGGTGVSVTSGAIAGVSAVSDIATNRFRRLQVLTDTLNL